MSEDQSAYLLKRYRAMDSEELVDLKAGDLTDVAREALNTVISERGIKTEEVAQKMLADDVKYSLDVAENQRIEEEKERRRDARYFKVGMCILVTLAIPGILGIFFVPQLAYGAIAIAMVQAVALAMVGFIIGGMVYVVKRARRKKKEHKRVVVL